MGEKSEQYESAVGKLHIWKENVKESWSGIKEHGLDESVRDKANDIREGVIRKINHGEANFDHLYRRKTRWELTRISAAVMGIEFSYAAETAFVSPTLLKIGVLHKHMTLIWCLSPLVGFFLTPIMGSLSDRCRSNLGRRRPFIIVLSIGVILGLILVPNGKWMGKQLGDRYPFEDGPFPPESSTMTPIIDEGPAGRMLGYGKDDDYDSETEAIDYDEAGEDIQKKLTDKFDVAVVERIGNNTDDDQKHHRHREGHPWGIFFTVLGTVLLDFDADACQSPSRAYLLDVTLPEDHAIGLSTFTIMAGLGGSLGYAMGGIDWGVLGDLFGGHVRLVFFLVLIIFIGCVFVTLTSFQEIPLDILAASQTTATKSRRTSEYYAFVPDGDGEEMSDRGVAQTYGTVSANGQDHVPGNPFVKKTEAGQYSSSHQDHTALEEEKKFLQVAETSFSQASPCPVDVEEDSSTKATIASFTQYLWTIIYMPSSLRVLCLTNLFCWMSLVCYSLYFTDFVGEAVFGGDPQADPGTEKRRLYDEGVRFGCWGMSMYSLSCSCYSFVIEKLVKRFRAKPVYIGGQLVYCVGMIFMALIQSKWSVLLFSWAAGVMYSTLFTMPYLLVAHYHETDTIQCEDVWFLRQIRQLLDRVKEGRDSSYSEAAAPVSSDPRRQAIESQVRGIGTDVGIVSSMVFLAQFILSLSMGSIINKFKTTVVVVVAASVLSFCGAVSAFFVTYLDL